ncbi:conserved hypothetical protein [Culex quinquefasciatus]|uniref:Uncharacterized protein n=1 Tax=Culex quinquefasciatus TaxID=7176 RepID=B0XFT9_CULQU|nr:conserved hypothetical protein [Culex quinquefasciatus]|eukprot:XP_001868511.1 conserved hypothetical protein [Culex quinquefasciatus]
MSCQTSLVLNTAEETNLYASNVRKFNGISSTSESGLDEKSAVQTPANVTTTAASTTTTTTATNKLDLTQALTSEDALYEVSVWFDGTELQFLSVIENKLAAPGLAESTQDLTGIDSSKQSSNGSMGSLGPFQLPSARPSADSHSSATDSSGTISSQSKAPLFKVKHTVRGAKLMIEEFTKIKTKTWDWTKAVPTRRRPKQPPKSGRGKKRIRTESKVETSFLEERQEAETGHTRTCRATKKKQGHKGDNKFMMLFEDGASKALSKDVIVIGDKDTRSPEATPTRPVSLTRSSGTKPPAKYWHRRGDRLRPISERGAGQLINWACKAAEGGADDPMQSPSANGKRGSATNTTILQTLDEASDAGGGEKGSRSTRMPRHRPIKTTGAPTYTPTPGQTSSPSPAANAPISIAAHILPTTSTGYAVGPSAPDAPSPNDLVLPAVVCVLSSQLCFGNSSAFRKVILPAVPAFRRVVLLAVVCARPSSSPRFRNSTVFRRAVLSLRRTSGRILVAWPVTTAAPSAFLSALLHTAFDSAALLYFVARVARKHKNLQGAEMQVPA